MTPLLLATSLSLIHPWDLVRVEDPNHPDALLRSQTYSVIEGPPASGTPWRYESIPELDRFPSEAVALTNADLWHADGAKGAGVNVAVFDIGWFDPLLDPAQIGPYTTHDCHTHPSCEVAIDTQRPRFGFEEGAHGFACAEAVRDIAPEVGLFLVRTNSVTGLENAVNWAVRHEIDVISMSMSFYNETHYDGGVSIFERLLKKLEAANILLVTSSGNNAQSHWSGGYLDVDGDGLMDFDGENRLALQVNASGTSVYVNWNQHGRCGDTDLDMVVVDDEGVVYGQSTNVQAYGEEQCQPVERTSVEVPEGGVYFLEIQKVTGLETNVHVDVLTRSGGSVVQAMPEGSMADPASHPLAFAVGAVRASRYLGGEAQSYSSRGPNHAGFPKPEIAGPDGLSSSVYGSEGFFGTSASAPVVAGLIALILSDNPGLTPREASRVLQGWAWGDDSSWSDPRWGAGKARLPVRDPGAAGCGRRPLLALVFMPPWWFRRRRRRAASSAP
ncbi:MAG: S8 family serine peptidase [Rhodobacterales bacterium]|nr:S8 family serine peptidase [Rhodobacterales bacterium]